MLDGDAWPSGPCALWHVGRHIYGRWGTRTELGCEKNHSDYPMHYAAYCGFVARLGHSVNN